MLFHHRWYSSFFCTVSAEDGATQAFLYYSLLSDVLGLRAGRETREESSFLSTHFVLPVS